MRERIAVNPGDRSGRLKVVSIVRQKSGIYLHCICDCGNEKRVYKGNFVSGKSKSCGCYAKEVTSAEKKTHGKSKSPIYGIWANMLRRCDYPKADRYDSYGGRGITVCEEWRNSFEQFYKDMGDKPSREHSIGRIDNDGDYCPDNCRWETREEQSCNTTRTVKAEVDGQVMTAKQISDKYSVPYHSIIGRIHSGKSGEDLKKQNIVLKMIDIDGVSMPTTYWMKKARIPISSFYHHIRKGRTKEEIVRMYLARSES